MDVSSLKNISRSTRVKEFRNLCVKFTCPCTRRCVTAESFVLVQFLARDQGMLWEFCFIPGSRLITSGVSPHLRL